MFRAIFSATFVTLLGLLLNLRSKTPRKWYIYALVFFGIIFGHLAIDYLYASEDFKFYLLDREYYLASKEKSQSSKTKREIL